jgi:hypothetical protein
MSLIRGSPWPLGGLFIPQKLRIEGGYLRWDAGSGEDPEIEPVPSARRLILEEFSRLTDSRGVLKFAKSYGVLGICRHGWPAAHNPPPTLTPPKVQAGRDLCYPSGWPEVRESLTRWLHFARQAYALLGIASMLHQVRRVWPGRDRGRIEAYWSTVFEDAKDIPQKFATGLAGDQRMSVFHLRQWVNLWLRVGNGQVSIKWQSPTASPSVELSGGTFAHLALQLAVAVTRSHDLSVCDGCQTPYLREGRKAQRGRRNYCRTCQAAGMPARDRKRIQRARLLRP